MIVKSSILIGLQKLEQKMKNGEDVYAFYTSTREEAELLQSVIDNQDAIFIVVDEKVGGSNARKNTTKKEAGSVRKNSTKKKA